MNKDNAHLYLPLVQALAEGKLQVNVADDRNPDWQGIEDCRFQFKPEYYRIKPASFPPIPEGMTLHNPDDLTPEQVGDEHRLLVTEEVDGRFADKASLWDPKSKGWSEQKYTAACMLKYSYRVDISTPYPDGSK